MNDLSPGEMLERTIRFWWVIAAAMILGGIAAWGFTLSHPPVYEATAVYNVSVDVEMLAGEQHLTPTQVPTDFNSLNVYLAPAADVFYQPEVRNRLVADASAQGIPLKYSDINAADFYQDRRGIRWLLSVRYTDPVKAAKLANLWVAATDAALHQAQAHAARVPILQAQDQSIQKCFTEMDFAQANQCAGTSFATPSELNAYLSGLDREIGTEKQASLDIDAALQFVLVHPADPPAQPVLYNKGLVLLAGCLIGLLLGILGVQRFPIPRK